MLSNLHPSLPPPLRIWIFFPLYPLFAFLPPSFSFSFSLSPFFFLLLFFSIFFSFYIIFPSKTPFRRRDTPHHQETWQVCKVPGQVVRGVCWWQPWVVAFEMHLFPFLTALRNHCRTLILSRSDPLGIKWEGGGCLNKKNLTSKSVTVKPIRNGDFKNKYIGTFSWRSRRFWN